MMSLKLPKVHALVFEVAAASPEITQLYLGKKIPDDLRKKGVNVSCEVFTKF